MNSKSTNQQLNIFVKLGKWLTFLAILSLSELNAQTLTRTISIGTDDVRESKSSGDITRTNSTLSLGNGIIGLRYQNITIPNSATITNADLRFRAASSGSNTLSLTIRAQAADNPATFSSTTYNVSSRAITTSSTTWNPGSWSSGSYYLINIAPVIQEVINRPGWASGNALVIIVDYPSSSTGSRSVYSYEGSNSNNSSLTINYTPCNNPVANPTFTNGPSTTRCQGTGTVNYTATATNATSITYSLNAASLAAGNTINTATGAVTYAATFTGTSTVTATAQGCQGPKTATHIVTVTPNVATPTFSGSPVTNRCRAGNTVSYTATSANATSVSYSITSSGTGTIPTINASTGQVTYAANWSGNATITATATGCGPNTTASITVNSVILQAVKDSTGGIIGQPISVNVTANDLCSPDNSSLTITSPPANGTVQIGTGGNITYLPNGSFVGTDQFTYQVCANSPNQSNCATAIVKVTVIDDGSDVCAVVNNPHTYYLPFPENTVQTRKAIRSSASSTANNNGIMRTIISIRTNYPGTVIHYDHWEDGYEATAGTNSQPSTRVWGDGNTANGFPPGFPTDILPEGAVITIDSTFGDRTSTTATNGGNKFDGKDKIHSTRALTIVKVTSDGGTTVPVPPATTGTPIFNLQNLKTNVIDVSKFGQLFVLPFGENISTLSNPTVTTGVFSYVGVFVRASENNTVVTLDVKGDGTVMESATLNEGQVWFYDGNETMPGTPPGGLAAPDPTIPANGPNRNGATDIRSGAIITSTKPVGVDLVFGDLFNYGTRNIPILPGKYYGNTYYSPVHDPAGTTDPTYAIFANSLNETMVINWENGSGGANSFTIPAKGFNSLRLAQQSAYKFSSANGKSFTAVTVIDVASNASGNPPNTGSPAGAFDWAFNMIPENQLSNLVGTAWAPGSGNNPQIGSQNFNPIWITAGTATTVYVRYDGKIVDGVGPLTSPCGLKYDVAVPLTALQAHRIYNPSGDQSGVSVYTCDGTKIAGVWGQYPGGTTPLGSPGMDVGYTLDPLCMDHIIVANNDTGRTFPNVPVTVSVLTNDVGALNPSSVVITTQPSNGTVVVNPDGTITYTPNPNYTGTDIFNYQVCNTKTPPACDIAQVYITIACAPAITGKNFISGKVFDDADADGVFDNTELGLAHKVYLYNDITPIGTLTSADVLVDSMTTDVSGVYKFERNYTTVANGRYIVQLAQPIPVGKFITQPTPANYHAIAFTAAGNECSRHFGIANEVTISGKVMNDVNGMTDATVNGVAYTQPMYVTLVDAVTGLVLANQLLDPTDGSYDFGYEDGVLPSKNYVVYLNENPVAVGTNVGATPIADLPADFVSTGEFIGTGAGNDGLPANGRINVTTTLVSVQDVNFGIQQPPYAGEGYHNTTNPGGTVMVPVPVTAFSNIEPSTDPTPGGVVSIRITSFPVGATSISINGVTYNNNPTDIATLTALVIPTNANGEPTWPISVDPTAVGNTAVVIDFKSIDAANKESNNTGKATVNFSTPSISGTVHEDTDGATNINGPLTNGNGLFVNVLNAANEVVYVAIVGVDCDGNTSAGNFCVPSGILEPANYTMQLSATAGTIGAQAPAFGIGSWYVVGESTGTTGNDGTPDAKLGVSLGAENISGLRFGISATPLPISLLSFTATKVAKTSVLSWATTLEIDNKGFYVERSAKGNTWTNLGFVNSKAENGNSTTKIDYQFTDATPLNGQNLYRLRQVDYNGKEEYSMVRSVHHGAERIISVFPNPANNHILVTGLEGAEVVMIYDAVGKIVKQHKADNSELKIDVSNLAEGDYYVRIVSNTDGKVTNVKFVKLN